MPNDQLIQGKIKDVVSTWVEEGRLFSAFEVSLAVKDQGVRERHRNMRDRVHEVIFRVGGPKGYSRTLMDVGAPEQAWVYHPQSTSPYYYQPLDRGEGRWEPDPSFVAPSLRNPSNLAWKSSAQAQVPIGAYGTDQRGRLCLPVAMVQSLGAAAGQRVEVQCKQGELVITRPAGMTDIAADLSYTVEPDGNVRLTQTTLDRAGIGGLQCYHIEGDRRAIVVRPFEE